MKAKYDVVIIGGSYAGLAAAMALGRSLRNVLIIDGGNPCNKQTPHSHNFLTQDGSTPAEIAELAKKQVELYSSVNFLQDFATMVEPAIQGFDVQTQSGATFTTRKLIVATGIKDIMPGIEGFAECWGISVLHCPYCHGYEVKGQQTGILADGDEGVELSALISNWSPDLTLYTNGITTLTEQQKARLHRHDVRIIEEKIIEIEHSKGYVKNLIFQNGSISGLTALYSRLKFQQHSLIPEQLGCELTAEGYIKVDAAQSTSVRGVYACGDAASRMRTVASAVSSGTVAGMLLNKELIEEDFK